LLPSTVDDAEKYVTAVTTATTNEGRALVATAEAAHRDVCRLSLPTAPYLTQLIATKYGLPQTRARCRADTHDAAAVYEAQSSSDAPPLHLLSREL
jgi:hypothetical protein